MFASLRRPLSVLLVGGTATAVLAGSVTTAVAAPASPLVTIDQVFAALPAAKLLPGAVRLDLKLETPGTASLDPCPETGDEVDVANGSLVGASYGPASSRTPQAKTANWELSAVVFHTVKAATVAAAQLVKAEKACPATADQDSAPWVRVLRQPYAVGAWKGYRSVHMFSTIDLIDGPDPEGERATDVYLTQGNVMLHIGETGSIQPGTSARQEAFRQSVTRLMIARLSALSAAQA